MPSSDHKKPTAAEIVEAIANRYADATWVSTPKEFVVLQPGDNEAAVKEKHDLAEAAVKSIVEAGAPLTVDDAKKLTVLEAIADIQTPDDASSHTQLATGVVVIEPTEGKVILPQYADEKSMAVVTLHELGHANLARLDLQKNAYLDYSSSWDSQMPENVLNVVRSITNNQDIQLESRDKFSSDAEYKNYLDAASQDNEVSKIRAAADLHGLVHESYADSFAILSIAAKDGPVKGSQLADSMQAFRVAEALRAKDGIGLDVHDSARGLGWLSSYLKTEPGQRLVSTLGDKALGDDARADMLHQTALMFSTLNVRRWAQTRGASQADGELVANWVSQTYRAEEIQMLSQPGNTRSTASAQKPEVYTDNKETISALGTRKDGSDIEKPVTATERPALTMERSR